MHTALINMHINKGSAELAKSVQIFNFFNVYFYLCMYVHCLPWVPWRPEEGTGFPGTGVMVVSHHLGAGNCSRTASNLNH